jgi:hypothetical protein
MDGLDKQILEENIEEFPNLQKLSIQVMFPYSTEVESILPKRVSVLIEFYLVFYPKIEACFTAVLSP